MLHTIGTVLAWIGALGIIGIGTAYLLRSEANAAGFGLPVLPADDARGWWQVKGIRDVATGVLVIAVSLASSSALGLVMLVLALIPIGDAAIILGNRGDRSAALWVHGTTAVAMVVAAALLTWG
jgi:hypothetical protein